MEAVLLSAYFVGTVGTILVRGLKEIKYQEGIQPETLTTSPGS
jgi:hypothetical protein